MIIRYVLILFIISCGNNKSDVVDFVIDMCEIEKDCTLFSDAINQSKLSDEQLVEKMDHYIRTGQSFDLHDIPVRFFTKSNLSERLKNIIHNKDTSSYKFTQNKNSLLTIFDSISLEGFDLSDYRSPIEIVQKYTCSH